MHFRVAAPLLALVVGLAGCSDDSASPNSGNLSREEALLLAGSIAEPASQTATSTQGRPAQDAIASDPMSFSHTMESTFNCPQGGSMALKWSVTGTVDVNAQSFVLDADGSQKPAACAYKHEGVTLTIDGDPILNFESHASFAGQTAREPITVKVDGAFKWSASDGRTGRCAIDFREVTDLNARKIEREGTVCGHTIKETFTWS